MEKSRSLIAVVGPTASGKSSLAIAIAKKLNGEVVSADSRQVYRGMDIGTGKVTKRETRGIPHHLLDIANPKRVFTVAEYVPLAKRSIEKVWAKGKLPIVCGGTGFYIDALILGTSIPDVPPNPELRERLKKVPVGELYAMLKKLDPRRAETIDAKNPVRIIRAIEIVDALGSVPKLTNEPIGGQVLWVGIHRNSDQLKHLIRVRLEARLKAGLLAEVKNLHGSGLSWKRMGELGLEYRFAAQHLTGKISKKEFVKQLAHAIEQYAKRQVTWFKKNHEIHWVKNERGTLALIKKFLGKK